MNRKIKFRAWDKSCNKMRGENGIKDCFSLRSDGVYNDDYILMQFTGLVDKNGKEIYEGDIIPYHFNENVKVVVKYGSYSNPCDDKHASHIGFYLEFQDEREKNMFRKDLGYWIKTTFVEGNIYENRELLKTNKDEK